MLAVSDGIVVDVRGWKKDGPSFTITSRQSGFRNRGRRVVTDQYGPKPGGKNVKSAEFHVEEVNDGVDLLLLNRGHEYEIDVLVDGEVQTHLSDARKRYQTLFLTNGVDFVAVRPVVEDVVVEDEDSVSDADEDQVQEG